MIFLDPRNDIAFKKLFGSEEHKNITISFLNSILELTDEKSIVSIDFLNNEQLPQPPSPMNVCYSGGYGEPRRSLSLREKCFERKSVGGMIDKKDNVLDIFCIDQAGNRYIVELQVANVKEFGKRMVYYGAKTYSLQLGKGKSYRNLMPVITLSIVNFVRRVMFLIV